MATLQELIEQYATELPDYLRVKPGQMAEVMGREPAAIRPEKKSSEFRMETPQISEAESRLRKDLEAGKERVKAANELYLAEQEALKKQIPEQKPVFAGGITPSRYLSELSASEQKLAGLAEKMAPKKAESDLLAEALITFLPALLGAGAGAAFAGPGGAGAGLAGGATAGAGAVSKMKEEAEKKRAQQAASAKAELDRQAALQAKKLDFMKEMALIEPKALAQFQQALQVGNAPTYLKEFQKKFAQGQIEESPAFKEKLAAEKSLQETEKALRDIRAKTGQKTVVSKSETPEVATQDSLGFGIVPDPKKTQTKEDRKKAQEIVSEYGPLHASTSDLLKELKSGVFRTPWSQADDQLKSKMAQLALDLKNSVIRSGANLTEPEIKMQDAIFPRELRGQDLARHLVNDKALPQKVLELQKSVFKRTLGRVVSYGYTFAPEAAPVQKSGLTPEQRAKRIEELQKKGAK